jgi:hypothetical protein
LTNAASSAFLPLAGKFHRLCRSSRVLFHSPRPASGIPDLMSKAHYRLLSLRLINNPAMTTKNSIVMGVISILIVTIVCLIIYAASLSSNDDKTQSVDRNGSIETGVSVVHADSTHDVILTSHKVWLHDSVYTIRSYRDTIPALDSIQKDYQIFITLK